MLATIEKNETGYLAKFDRQLQHSAEEVWSWLTDNDNLQKWFSELRVDELKKGGFIKFDMGNGTFEKMEILDLELNSVLEYTWGEDVVRFELTPNERGCKLVLKEKIMTITDHTPRDLAGWHVCLDVIETLMAGRTIDNRKKEWEKWYVEYVKVIDDVKNK